MTFRDIGKALGIHHTVALRDFEHVFQQVPPTDIRLCSAKTFRSWHETPIAVSNFQQATSTTGGLLYHARGTELAQDRE